MVLDVVCWTSKIDMDLECKGAKIMDVQSFIGLEQRRELKQPPVNLAKAALSLIKGEVAEMNNLENGLKICLKMEKVISAFLNFWQNLFFLPEL